MFRPRLAAEIESGGRLSPDASDADSKNILLPCRVMVSPGRIRGMQCGQEPRARTARSFAIPQRGAPGSGKNPSAPKKEGGGNAGRPMDPEPRGQNEKAHERSHHRSTGITRHSRTQWFYGLCRALPGDEFVLSPSSAD